MIAISDIVLLTVSSAVLAVALIRANGPDTPATNYKPQASSESTVNAGTVTSGQSNDQSSLQTDQTGDQSAATSTTLNSTTATDSTATTTSTDTTTQSNQAVTPLYATYTVQSGDSLSKIAAQFGTSVSELQALNDLSSTRILVGQELRYPEQ